MLTRKLQKIGNSKGIILTNDMLAHLGLEDRVVITFQEDSIVLRAPASESKLTPGRNRQSKEDAMRSTFEQYDVALQRLADASSELG